MTEFTLSAYLISGTTAVSSAFGSNDPAIKTHVLTQTAPLIAEFGGPTAQDRISNGLDHILSTPTIATYTYDVALATEMLFAAYGTQPDSHQAATILGFTEDCLPALEALQMPTLHRAMDILAWGQEVILPVPIKAWDDVTGQFYFDAQSQAAALSEFARLGDIFEAVEVLDDTHPDLFDECDPADLEWTLEFYEAVLGEAQNKSMDLVLFRHGGI